VHALLTIEKSLSIPAERPFDYMMQYWEHHLLFQDSSPVNNKKPNDQLKYTDTQGFNFH